MDTSLENLLQVINTLMVEQLTKQEKQLLTAGFLTSIQWNQ